MRRYRSRGSVGARALVAGSVAIGLALSPRAVAGQKPPGPLLSPAGADAALSANQECCRLLLLPVGARQAAMATAATPVASPDAVFYNPAGLAQLEGSHFVLHHVESSFQPYDAFTLLISPWDLAVFGVSYALLDYGDQEVTGGDETSVGRISVVDHLLVASFATTLLPNLSAGLNYKFYNWRIDCSGQCGNTRNLSAKTHALDFGLQYEPAWAPQVRVGAALLNAGVPLQVQNAEQADPLPTRLRVGLSYDVLEHLDSAGPYSLEILVEAQENDWKEPTTPRTSVGFEASINEVFFLRAGYGAGEGSAGGPAVGVGVIYSRFNVSVAKHVDGGVDGDEPFQLTVDVGF